MLQTFQKSKCFVKKIFLVHSFIGVFWRILRQILQHFPLRKALIFDISYYTVNLLLPLSWVTFLNIFMMCKCAPLINKQVKILQINSNQIKPGQKVSSHLIKTLRYLYQSRNHSKNVDCSTSSLIFAKFPLSATQRH